MSDHVSNDLSNDQNNLIFGPSVQHTQEQEIDSDPSEISAAPAPLVLGETNSELLAPEAGTPSAPPLQDHSMHPAVHTSPATRTAPASSLAPETDVSPGVSLHDSTNETAAGSSSMQPEYTRPVTRFTIRYKYW